MINILIRTHDRPSLFEKCIESIEEQTYKDWNIIISADNKYAAKWVEKYDYEFIRTDKIKYRGFKKGYIRAKEKTTKRRIYWNLYFNTLQDLVKKGFILYLDEDMVLKSHNSLQLIADNSHENKLLIFQYQSTPDNERIARPTRMNWNKKPTRGSISTGCFSHHSNYKARWVPQRAGDYFAVSNLYGQLKADWLYKIIVKAQILE